MSIEVDEPSCAGGENVCDEIGTMGFLTSALMHIKGSDRVSWKLSVSVLLQSYGRGVVGCECEG